MLSAASADMSVYAGLIAGLLRGETILRSKMRVFCVFGGAILRRDFSVSKVGAERARETSFFDGESGSPVALWRK